MANDKGSSDIEMRLRRVEGQIRGIIGMLHDGKSCEDVVTQILAARAGIECAAREVLKCQVADALADSPSAGARVSLERAIELLTKV